MSSNGGSVFRRLESESSSVVKMHEQSNDGNSSVGGNSPHRKADRVQQINDFDSDEDPIVNASPEPLDPTSPMA